MEPRDLRHEVFCACKTRPLWRDPHEARPCAYTQCGSWSSPFSRLLLLHHWARQVGGGQRPCVAWSEKARRDPYVRNAAQSIQTGSKRALAVPNAQLAALVASWPEWQPFSLRALAGESVQT